ncbi:hypothetical protein [Streptomyces sp. NPDC047928]|uniref:hypothetical protein n=1 Tax=unclassified Streptomyces TaxID=2593676 RepID=UPI0037228482
MTKRGPDGRPLGLGLALRLLGAVWLCLGVSYFVRLWVDDAEIPVGLPAAMFLTVVLHDHYRGRYPALLVGSVVGFFTMFHLVDRFRGPLDRLEAEILAVALAAVPAVVVFTVGARICDGRGTGTRSASRPDSGSGAGAGSGPSSGHAAG